MSQISAMNSDDIDLDEIEEDEEEEEEEPKAGSSHQSGSGGAPTAPGPSHSQHHSSKIDLANATRGIWLVKVPKYLATRWERIPDDVDAARLRIYRPEGPPGNGKVTVTLSLSEATMCLKEDGEGEIPKEHELIVSSLANQTLGVFSTEYNEELGTTKVGIEGRIQQRLDCRPVADLNYMQHKLEEIKKVSQPARQMIQLDRVVQNYKPVADHKNNIEYEERKKTEGKKSRDDKDRVLEMLFAAFEKHQFYNLKDLVRVTNQPVGYLKEVLKEVCNYCVKNPHKNMWELKPEYRHYKEDVEEED
jgi:transcription initiation factor TFIIF subunit beta